MFPDIPPELSDEFMEYIKRRPFIPLSDPYVPSMSFAKFKETLGKRRNVMVIDEPTQIKLIGSINPTRESSWIKEFEKWLKDKKDEKMKFEIGDRVRCKDVVGTVVRVHPSTNNYLVRFDGTKAALIMAEYKLGFENPKLAFLTRLQELLATFDATICDYEQYKLCIDLGDGEQMEWYWGDKPMDKSRLAADNVFDYDTD